MTPGGKHRFTFLQQDADMWQAITTLEQAGLVLPINMVSTCKALTLQHQGLSRSVLFQIVLALTNLVMVTATMLILLAQLADISRICNRVMEVAMVVTSFR